MNDIDYENFYLLNEQDLQCKKHPTYAGAAAPETKCLTCFVIYLDSLYDHNADTEALKLVDKLITKRGLK